MEIRNMSQFVAGFSAGQRMRGKQSGKLAEKSTAVEGTTDADYSQGYAFGLASYGAVYRAEADYQPATFYEWANYYVGSDFPDNNDEYLEYIQENKEEFIPVGEGEQFQVAPVCYIESTHPEIHSTITQSGGVWTVNGVFIGEKMVVDPFSWYLIAHLMTEPMILNPGRYRLALMNSPYVPGYIAPQYRWWSAEAIPGGYIKTIKVNYEDTQWNVGGSVEWRDYQTREFTLDLKETSGVVLDTNAYSYAPGFFSLNADGEYGNGSAITIREDFTLTYVSRYKPWTAIKAGDIQGMFIAYSYGDYSSGVYKSFFTPMPQPVIEFESPVVVNGVIMRAKYIDPDASTIGADGNVDYVYRYVPAERFSYDYEKRIYYMNFYDDPKGGYRVLIVFDEKAMGINSQHYRSGSYKTGKFIHAYYHTPPEREAV